MSRPPWHHLTTQGVEDAKKKIATYTEKAEKVEEELKAVNQELEKLIKQVQDTPPPEEFSQEWAQENRRLVRSISSREQERMNLIRAKTTAAQNHEAYLRHLETEAQRQLKADRLWYEKRQTEYLQRHQAAKNSVDQLKINPILTDLRALVIDEDSRDKVLQALKDIQDPEVVAAINRVRPNFNIDFHRGQARTRLSEYEQSRT